PHAIVLPPARGRLQRERARDTYHLGGECDDLPPYDLSPTDTGILSPLGRVCLPADGPGLPLRGRLPLREARHSLRRKTRPSCWHDDSGRGLPPAQPALGCDPLPHLAPARTSR